MIAAIKGAHGAELAEVACDFCGASKSFPAAHGNCGDFGRGDVRALTLRNRGQAVKKMQKIGWSLIKNRLRCPDCEAIRKLEIAHYRETKMETKIAAVMPDMPDGLRRPTPAQKRQIISMLEAVYDDQAKRYSGRETDKTVADAIGGGVMWGWVAEIREDLFGPDGSNAEIDAVRAELADAIKSAGALAGEIEKRLGELRDLRGKFDELYGRIEAVKRAVGPKAR